MSPSENLPPNDAPPLALWRTMLRTTFSLRQAVRPVFAAHGLTGPQWHVLNILGEAGPSGLTLGEVTDRLLHTPGNTTGIVDKLEEGGLVQRTPHPEDRRAILVSLTREGEGVYTAIKPALSERAGELFGCLSAREQATLHGLFERLLEHVRDLPATGGDCGACGDPSR
jgi:DNA-binding MarR family transcriptional regulator